MNHESLHNFRGQLFVEQSRVHGQEGFVAAVLHYAFSFAMYQYGALFGLLYGVTADVHQCLDDIVEGVHIVVV